MFLAVAALDFHFFVHRVQPIFLKKREGAARCYDCHSLKSNKSLLRLAETNPDGKWNTRQSRQNYESVVTLVDRKDPLNSRLLLHPLSAEAGGDPFHTGGKFWTSKNDPEWKMLADWIRAK